MPQGWRNHAFVVGKRTAIQSDKTISRSQVNPVANRHTNPRHSSNRTMGWAFHPGGSSQNPVSKLTGRQWVSAAAAASATTAATGTAAPGRALDLADTE